MEARRAKGLCFNCDDKFSRGHRCKAKQFLLLLSEEDSPPEPELAILDPGLKEPDPSETPEFCSAASSPLCEYFHLSRAALTSPLSSHPTCTRTC